MRGLRLAAAAALWLLIPLQYGCSSAGVKPWERAYLAKRSMALEPNAHEAALKQHTYFSKEAASGGYGVGGGGCGCN